MTTEVTIQRGIFTPQSVSKMRVVMTSSREKADVRPRRKSVMKKMTAKKLEPGLNVEFSKCLAANIVHLQTHICARASGYVMNPVTKVPRGSPVEGSRPKYPTTPKTAKAAMISTNELLIPMMRASCTALEC